uniref:Chemosensory protein 19 n=1 Tax=Heliconius charithonia TaxID=33434 RepID=A0AA49FPN5_HELCH|nr:chemosensory protein 19 [Heliconius charithonia]
MKTILILAATLAVALAYPADTYNPLYDNFNAQELIENVRLLRNYGKCFLYQGPCTAEGFDFRKAIPDALKTNCGRCSLKQRQLIRDVVRGFQTKLPDIWDELTEKEDPKGEYKESFEKFLSSSD